MIKYQYGGQRAWLGAMGVTHGHTRAGNANKAPKMPCYWLMASATGVCQGVTTKNRTVSHLPSSLPGSKLSLCITPT